MEDAPKTGGKESQPAPVILRLKQVQSRVGLGRSSIYSKLNRKSPHYDESFPRSIRIAEKSVGWLESEISAWITTRAIAGRI